MYVWAFFKAFPKQIVSFTLFNTVLNRFIHSPLKIKPIAQKYKITKY